MYVLCFYHLTGECDNNKSWLTVIKIVRLRLLFSKDGLGDSLPATKKGNIILSTAVGSSITIRLICFSLRTDEEKFGIANSICISIC